MAARIDFHTTIPGVEISVTDSQFHEVAHGFGRVSKEVDPGIYQVRLRAGRNVSTQLVALRQGEIFATPPPIDFESAAPIQGTTTSHEYQMDAAHEASRQLSRLPSRGAGVVLMVRNLRGQEELPLDGARLAGIEWMDRTLAPIPGFKDAWHVNPTEKWATFVAPVEPGGYALRVTRPDEQGGTLVFEQPIWASPGWQTLVFIPNLTSGPAPESASVHMVQIYAEWDPFIDPRTSQALELALWGLRDGRGVVPDNFLDLLLGSKFQNPMLGIVGAHALLLRADPDFALLDTVVRNLRQLASDHPDIAALEWMAHEARGQRDTAPAPAAARLAVSWPPMLMASYAALIRLDAADPGVIRDESTAELVAARLISLGPWTAWRRGTRPRRTVGAVRRVERVPLPPELMTDYEHPATQRVASYLSGVAEVKEIGSLPELLSQVEPRQISLATGLPTASVRRALADFGHGRGVAG